MKSKSYTWLLYFSCSMIIAMVFRGIILPLLPEYHAGSGILKGDALLFHKTAIEYAQFLKENGINHFSFWLNEKTTGNVSILALFYYFFGVNSALLLPLNCALHALAGIGFIELYSDSDKTKTNSGFVYITASFFILLPTALEWYSQNHKDGYSIIAWLLIILPLVSTPSKDFSFKWLGMLLLGCLIFYIIRPHYFQLIFITLTITSAYQLLYIFITKTSSKWNVLNISLTFLVPMLIFLSIRTSFYAKESYIFSNYLVFNKSNISLSEEDLKRCSKWHWNKSDIVPSPISDAAKTLANIRLLHICTIGKGRSSIDFEITPTSFKDLIMQMPRALQIALFAPFPRFLTQDMNIKKVASLLIQFFQYIIFLGYLIVLLKRVYTYKVILILLFTMPTLTMLGLTLPNVGHINRMRIPFLFILNYIGVLGLSLVFNFKLPSPKEKNIKILTWVLSIISTVIFFYFL